MNKDKDDQLLDIHQAAHFLNVSIVSVRRYTDAGLLRCLRVGRRPERRFRQADLEAFLVQKRGEAGPVPPPPGEAETAQPRPVHVALEGLEIDYGTHLCQLYETDSGRTKMSVPFIADGLAAGDACFLIACKPVADGLLRALKQRRGTLEADIEAGRLQLVCHVGSGKEMLELLEAEFNQALQRGYKFLRLVGDMAWFLDANLDSEELVDFEMRYDQIVGHSYPVVSLCLYDTRRFTGVDILHALKCHEDTFKLPLARFLAR